MEYKWKFISQKNYDALEHKDPETMYAVLSIAPWWRPFQRRRDLAYLRRIKNDPVLGSLVGHSIFDAQQVEDLYRNAKQTEKLYLQEEKDGRHGEGPESDRA